MFSRRCRQTLSAHERSADDRACLVQRHTYITQTEAYKGLNKAWLTARTTMAWLWFVGPCRAAVVTAVHRTRGEHATGCTSRLAGGAAPIVQSVCALRQWPCSAGPVALRHVIPPPSERERAWRRLPRPCIALEESTWRAVRLALPAARLPSDGLCALRQRPCGAGPAPCDTAPPKRARGRVGHDGRFPPLWSANKLT